MNDQRWKDVQENDNIKLASEEIAEGWHFCCEFDGLLVGPGSGELTCCSCLPKDHPVYKTIEYPETEPVDLNNIEAGNIREDDRDEDTFIEGTTMKDPTPLGF